MILLIHRFQALLPLVNLVREVGSRHGLQVVPVGEAMLSDLQVRPDYAVQVDGAICGYIEIRSPVSAQMPPR